jgi:hypothetical protein
MMRIKELDMSLNAKPPGALSPHLFEGEEEVIRHAMNGASCYLEFGTGGSTLMAIECGVRRIVSVDSDQQWSLEIEREIPDARKPDVE